VITGVERRGMWSAKAKAEIFAESLAEGAIVSEAARRRRAGAGGPLLKIDVVSSLTGHSGIVLVDFRSTI